jgi:6-phosphogluconate dehydrogenase
MNSRQADIGLIGLAVMGQNLVLNMNDHGFVVAVFNRTVEKVDLFLQGPAKNTRVLGCRALSEFFRCLKRPRKVILMVKAGKAVDDLIEESLPFLEAGDILIDGGNSFYGDTERRCRFVQERGMFFMGVGISGGEEGARHGPSIMPGGSVEAWKETSTIFQAIAARSEEDGRPCCEWIGEGGAGHYVKMVHNGIEYGDMQLICEAYDILHRALSYPHRDIQKIFTLWNQGPLQSYLIEITSRILEKQDADGALLLDKILDVAHQKGTGQWTSQEALRQGAPVTLIAEAVFARYLSAMQGEREQMFALYSPEKCSVQPIAEKGQEVVDDLEQALYAAKIISYAQGFLLMHRVASDRGWKLHFDAIALIWRGGCIIRSRFLNAIAEAFQSIPELDNLLLAPFFQKALLKAARGWRLTLSRGIHSGIPMPCLGAALSFWDGMRCNRLPANLLQAQRDFFGAHTYERRDQPRGTFFHTQW